MTPGLVTHAGLRHETTPAEHPIAWTATSVAAFIGRALQGPLDRPVRIRSYAEYASVFGGLWRAGSMSHAVSHFFRHGGREAFVVRVFNGNPASASATITLPTATGSLVLEASSPGAWGSALRALVEHPQRRDGTAAVFHLTLEQLDQPGGSRVVASERFRDLSGAADDPRFVGLVLERESRLARLRSCPPEGEAPGVTRTEGIAAAGSADDGEPVTDLQVMGDRTARTGLFALESAELFNLLCIPPLGSESDIPPAGAGACWPDVDNATWAAAAAYCRERRALLIVDPPAAWTSDPRRAVTRAEAGIADMLTSFGSEDACNAIAYFPRLHLREPLGHNGNGTFAPCGAIAGIIARTDAQRGVWKAPSGVEASFNDVQAFTHAVSDADNSRLNPLGVNCLRSFPVAGNVVWGARTLAGAEPSHARWRYLPVRRTALFLEESILRGTRWVSSQPDGPLLRARLRGQVADFMQRLFLRGAFQGRSSGEAYYVECQGDTSDQGHVDIVVGFALLKPSNFVEVRIRQATAPPIDESQ